MHCWNWKHGVLLVLLGVKSQTIVAFKYKYTLKGSLACQENAHRNSLHVNHSNSIYSSPTTASSCSESMCIQSLISACQTQTITHSLTLKSNWEFHDFSKEETREPKRDSHWSRSTTLCIRQKEQFWSQHSTVSIKMSP